MAERRSFSIHVVESDDFHNLSLPAQALYFHLGLRARDKECRVCGTTDNLQAHHIKSFSEFPLLRFCIENGITLCERCHKELHRKEKENGRC